MICILSSLTIQSDFIFEEVKCEIGIMTRTERLLVLFFSLILCNFVDFILLISIIAIFVLSLFTVFQRINHIYKSI